MRHVDMRRVDIEKMDYGMLSLIDLIERIVIDSDKEALSEFHENRSLFHFGGKTDLVLSEYATALKNDLIHKNRFGGKTVPVAEKAYDILIDRFINIPEDNTDKTEKNPPNMKPTKTDCRLYYGAYLHHVRNRLRQNRKMTPLEQECLAASSMAGFVNRQFALCILEALRQTSRFWSRYNWALATGTICVWMPVTIQGGDRRRWLEENIPGADPEAPGERLRIQRIVNRSFSRELMLSFDEERHSPNSESNPDVDRPEESFQVSLARKVAERKSDHIETQRPSIRALGKDRLRKLILRIFDEIQDESYMDKQVADDLGVSRAAFSRFAGSRWHMRKGRIPDLFMNTAKVLSGNQAFIDAVKEAGFWNVVNGVIGQNTDGTEMNE